MRLLRCITSIKTAVVLLIIIAVCALLATFIPQGGSREEYESIYGSTGAEIVLRLALNRFFRSPLFLLPMAGLFLNLSACTVKRIVSQFDGRRKNFAPDLLHLGILVLIVAAVFSAVGRKAVPFTLGEGEAVRLDGGYTVALREFEMLSYPDGRVKDYISYLQVSSGDRLLHESYPLEVNHPLRLGTLRIYQSRYYRKAVVALEAPTGVIHRMVSGRPFCIGGGTYVIEGFSEAEGGNGSGGKASVLLREEASGVLYRLGRGDEFFGLRVASVEAAEYSGLNAVWDPGYPVLLAGFIMVLSGLSAHYLFRLIRRSRK